MTAFTHTIGILGAGVLAFGVVLAAHQLTAPLNETAEPRPPVITVPQETHGSPEAGEGPEDPSTVAPDLPLAETADTSHRRSSGASRHPARRERSRCDEAAG